MVNWKSEYLAMKLKYINAKQKAGVRRRQAPRVTSEPPKPHISDNHLTNFINYYKYDDEDYLNAIPDDEIMEIFENAFFQKLVFEDFQKLVLDGVADDEKVDFIKKNKYLILFILVIEKYEVFDFLYPIEDESNVKLIDDMILSYKDVFINEHFIRDGFKDNFLQFIQVNLGNTDIDDLTKFVKDYDDAIKEFFEIIS